MDKNLEFSTDCWQQHPNSKCSMSQLSLYSTTDLWLKSNLSWMFFRASLKQRPWNSHRDCNIHKEKECPACMTRQMPAVLIPVSYTVLENKTIFDPTPNFLFFTISILGPQINRRKNVSHNILCEYQDRKGNRRFEYQDTSRHREEGSA